MSEIIEVKEEENKVQIQQEINPLSLIQTAIEKGMDVDKLERLFDLQERYEKNLAVKAFNIAFAAFQYSCPSIPKKAYPDTRFNSSSFDDIAENIKEPLMINGLSYKFSQKVEGNLLFVKCTLQHKMGHFIETELCADRDLSGGKNSIQGLGSTNSYLYRYTIIAVMGLAQCEMQDDGEMAPDPKKQGFYPQERFNSMLEKSWNGAIKEGRQTTQSIVDYMKNQKKENLTEDQINILNQIKKD